MGTRLAVGMLTPAMRATCGVLSSRARNPRPFFHNGSPGHEGRRARVRFSMVRDGGRPVFPNRFSFEMGCNKGSRPERQGYVKVCLGACRDDLPRTLWRASATSPREAPDRAGGRPGSAVENARDTFRHLVDLAQPRHPVQVALAMVISDERRGLLVIFHEAGAQAFLVVVGARLLPGGAGFLGPAEDTLHKGFVIDLHLYDRVEGLAVPGQKIAERVGLGQRAGKSVEDDAVAGVALEFFLDQADDDLVGDQLAGIHDRRDLVAHFRPRRARLPKHVACRELDHPASLDQNARLRPLTGPRRAEKYDVHRLAVPFPRPRRFPRSCDFSISPSY